MPARDTIVAVANGLLRYCERNDWAGYDPYDALNSRVFRRTLFYRSKTCRIAFTQLMKRCPINLRELLGVPRRRNPKGTALFIAALIRLTRAGVCANDATVGSLCRDLIAARSQGAGYAGWGYSFDWQTRGDLVPEGTPNIICTTFAGNALLDAWGACHDDQYLDLSVSAAQFLHETLAVKTEEGGLCFSYTPLSPSRIHNANLLGAAYLARVARAAGRHDLLASALRAARYSAGKQAADGSWPYGESSTQRWIDNFHTGYNLCALQSIARYAETDEFGPVIQRGLGFYVAHFFTSDGAPKYFHNRTYPIDIHSVAQSIITLQTFSGDGSGCGQVKNEVVRWAFDHMLSADGYFYYQKLPLAKNRIPYMRWGQAWMLLALSVLLDSR